MDPPRRCDTCQFGAKTVWRLRSLLLLLLVVCGHAEELLSALVADGALLEVRRRRRLRRSSLERGSISDYAVVLACLKFQRYCVKKFNCGLSRLLL